MSRGELEVCFNEKGGKKMKEKIKRLSGKVKEQILNKKGNEIVAVALVLLFIILAAAPYLKTLGETTSTGIRNLIKQMEKVLDNDD